jgi:hypothetical protein
VAPWYDCGKVLAINNRGLLMDAAFEQLLPYFQVGAYAICTGLFGWLIVHGIPKLLDSAHAERREIMQAAAKEREDFRKSLSDTVNTIGGEIREGNKRIGDEIIKSNTIMANTLQEVRNELHRIAERQ